jgi:hypothetical protein
MPRKSAKMPLYRDPRPLVERPIAQDEKTRKASRSVTVNLAESPLSWSWDNMPMSRNRRAAPSPLSQSERVLAAKSRFDDAILALGGDLSDIAWRVICAGEGIPVAERGMGWPARSGKLVLRIALDRLAQHYRLPG